MNQLRNLFYIRPEVVFLNHGSFGACPRPVMKAYQDWQIELEHQPVEFIVRRFGKLMQDSRDTLAAFLGAEGNDILYVPNTTTGLNLVARSLPLKAGDEILTTDHEYPAMNRMWEFICQKRGAHYIRQPVNLPLESTEQVVETIWSAVTERTRVLFLSHITSPTALTFPIEPLIKRAKAAGILTVIDGAHVPGQLEIDLNSLQVDFYTGNCHKWMMTPKGSGFLYARAEVQSLIEPLVVSLADKSLPDTAFIKENEYQGTSDVAAYLAVPTAINFMKEHHWDTVRHSCHELVTYGRQRLIEITGYPPICPENNGWFRQMAAHPLPDCDAEVFQQRLYDEFAVEVPIFEHRGKAYLRISIQGYNTREDLDALANALTVLLKEH